MPIRGHSNVQGIGSVCVTPKLKAQIFDALQKKYQLQLPTSIGKDTECMEAASRYELSFGFSLVAICLVPILIPDSRRSRFRVWT